MADVGHISLPMMVNLKTLTLENVVLLNMFFFGQSNSCNILIMETYLSKLSYLGFIGIFQKSYVYMEEFL